MGIGEKLITLIVDRRERRRRQAQGAVGEFWRAGGNELLVENLPIDTASVVVDAGAYRGEWLEPVIIRYGCEIVAFEAVPEFARVLQDRYAKNNRIEVRVAALGAENGLTEISISADGSTLVKQRSAPENNRQVINVSAAIEEMRCAAARAPLACVKLNIEGAEFEVLESLAEADCLKLARCWLIQFHDVGALSEVRRASIRAQLERTHTCVWCFDWVWEKWVRADVLSEGGG